MQRIAVFVSACLIAITLNTETRAELAISANDGKQVSPDDVVKQPVPDTVSVLDVRDGKVKILGSVDAPASMIGPPTSVAVARDGSFALVTSSQKLMGGKLVPDDVVSVIDLSKPSNPRVSQTLHAGPGASGISISPSGKLALVASTGDDSITAFAIAGRSLRFLGKVSVEPKAGPTDVVFSADGKVAIVVGRGNSKLMVLSIEGNKVTNTGTKFLSGMSPYSAAVTHDGKYLIVNNLRGALVPTQPANAARSMERGPAPRRSGTLSMIDINTGGIVASVETGALPEGAILSPDGRYLAVDSANGSPNSPSDPNFNKLFARLEIFAVGDGILTPVTQAAAGHWCQGMTFSKDGRTILLQCAVEKEIETYHFDGRTLARDNHLTIFIGSRPGAIATSLSR
jgi:DNA-binding beta-propeller fold protein YncE